MNKIIIIFALFLIMIGGFVFYQFNTKSIKQQGKVTIGKQNFAVEVVKKPKDQQIGLTKYESLKDDQGMLFAFETSDTYGFWMKNMKFPIDIIFINNDTIVSVFDSVPIQPNNAVNPPIYHPEGPSNTVLEIKAGLAKKYGIKKGDHIEIKI